MPMPGVERISLNILSLSFYQFYQGSYVCLCEFPSGHFFTIIFKITVFNDAHFTQSLVSWRIQQYYSILNIDNIHISQCRLNSTSFAGGRLST
jgi:hypothetical protein